MYVKKKINMVHLHYRLNRQELEKKGKESDFLRQDQYKNLYPQVFHPLVGTGLYVNGSLSETKAYF